jgi:hypothetical protein
MLKLLGENLVDSRVSLLLVFRVGELPGDVSRELSSGSRDDQLTQHRQRERCAAGGDRSLPTHWVTCAQQ